METYLGLVSYVVVEEIPTALRTEQKTIRMYVGCKRRDYNLSIVLNLTSILSLSPQTPGQNDLFRIGLQTKRQACV